MMDCSIFARWLILTLVLASFVKLHVHVQTYLEIMKQHASETSPSAVLYENFTTPNFTLKIHFEWIDGRQPDASTKKNRTSTPAVKRGEHNLSNSKDVPERSDSLTVNMDEVNEWSFMLYKKVEEREVSNSGVLPVSVGEVMGKIDQGQLVVEVNETFVFWQTGQRRLCDLLRKMTCSKMLGGDTSPLSRPPLLNVTLDCEALSQRQDFGQGNWITALYCVRIAAAKARVDFQFQCSSGRDSQEKLLLPWFSGSQPAPRKDDPWPYDGVVPSEKEACTDRYPLIKVEKMTHEIQRDIRQMAVALVGSQGHDEEIVVPTGTPLYPEIDLDDVAIHFRCGDVFGGSSRNDFGIIKFTEYKEWIYNNTKSIGILTQPFDKQLNRKADSARVGACQKAVSLLVDTLKQSFPEAKISIHNGPTESLPLAYARLAMAKQSFTSLSSFGIFPVIGTFGEGYFQKGNRGVNPFAWKIPSILSNVHQMDAPVISTGQIKAAGIDATLEWLVSEGSENFGIP